MDLTDKLSPARRFAENDAISRQVREPHGLRSDKLSALSSLALRELSGILFFFRDGHRTDPVAGVRTTPKGERNFIASQGREKDIHLPRGARTMNFAPLPPRELGLACSRFP